MEPAKHEFHLEEYKVVRRKLEWLVTQYYRLPVYAAVGSFAIFSVLLAKDIDTAYSTVAELAWFFPAFLTLILSISNAAIFFEILHHGAYSRKIEHELADGSLRGWEHFRGSEKSATLSAGIWVTVVFYALLLAGDCIIGALAIGAAE